VVCPADINLNADCDATTREIFFDCPYAVDQCGMPKAWFECTPLTGIPCDPDWITNCGGEFPQGAWLFTAYGEDNECYDGTPTCSWTVSVSSYQQMNIEVQLSPLMDPGPFWRCIEFKAYNYCHPYPDFQTFKEDIEFGGPYNIAGHGTAEIKVPKGQYECIQARDQLHSLWNSAMIECLEGGVYEAIFKGDPFFEGGNWLTMGNLDGMGEAPLWSPRVIDIVDYGIFVSQFLTKPDPNTLCADKPFVDPPDVPWEASMAHADINGDGVVDDVDFSFISVNFLQMDKGLKCCDEPARSIVGRTEITVREAEAMGLGSAGDLNRDGLLNQEDLKEFQKGNWPKDPNLRPDR
jgi:hypothetical protein